MKGHLALVECFWLFILIIVGQFVIDLLNSMIWPFFADLSKF